MRRMRICRKERMNLVGQEGKIGKVAEFVHKVKKEFFCKKLIAKAKKKQ